MKIGFVVVLRGGMNTPAPAPRYTAVREMALHAEALGFDSLWLYDHLLYRDAGHPPVGMLGMLDGAFGLGGGDQTGRVRHLSPLQ